MKIEQALILEQNLIRGKYRVIRFKAPAIASKVKPGQFVHVRIPGMPDALLRRPFSIYKADKSTFSVLYKEVGKGTAVMGSLVKGAKVSIIGPLGNNFPKPNKNRIPVLVAGGYGVAPLSLFASRLAAKGKIFIGGASKEDILCDQDFKKLGWDVCFATVDGSKGMKGYVTVALMDWLAKLPKSVIPEFYACGPDGMLKAVGKLAVDGGFRAWLSLDKHMGCGVGACLACVQKVTGENGKTILMRVCKDGPIFDAAKIVW